MYFQHLIHSTAVVFLFSCSLLEAATITKIKGDKAAASTKNESFEVGDVVRIADEFDNDLGEAVVAAVKGTRIVIKKRSGAFNVGDTVVSHRPEGSSAQNSSNRRETHGKDLGAIGVYLGQYSSDLSPAPIAFGADYKFKLNVLKNVVWRAGLTYWSVSSSGFKVSLIEASAGGGYQFIFDKFELDVGARLGYASIKASASVPGVTVSLSTSSFTFTPFASGLYRLTPGIAVGLELRMANYFSGKGSFGGDNYFLINGEFRL